MSTQSRISSLATPYIAALLLTACADRPPLAPEVGMAPGATMAALPQTAELNAALATLRLATAPFHDLQTARDSGFVFLHPCEDRPGEGPVGAVYVHPGRMMDGRIDPARPDALIYQEAGDGRAQLVGVEFAVPYALWTGPGDPQFFGATFQREDEFGVFGLHAWVWLDNPDGVFAIGNPRVSCASEE